MDRGHLLGLVGFVIGAVGAVGISTVVVTAATARVSGDPTPLDLTAATAPGPVDESQPPAGSSAPSPAASPTAAPTTAAAPSPTATSAPQPSATTAPADDPSDEPTPSSTPDDDPSDDPSDGPTDQPTTRPTPSPTPAPSESDRPADDRIDERRTASAVGGTARFHFTDRGIDVLFATPNQGFRVEVQRDGPFDVRVLFLSPDHVSRIDAEIEDGQPRVRVREDTRD